MSSCTVFVFASLMEYALVNILMADEETTVSFHHPLVPRGAPAPPPAPHSMIHHHHGNGGEMGSPTHSQAMSPDSNPPSPGSGGTGPGGGTAGQPSPSPNVPPSHHTRPNSVFIAQRSLESRDSVGHHGGINASLIVDARESPHVGGNGTTTTRTAPTTGGGGFRKRSSSTILASFNRFSSGKASHTRPFVPLCMRINHFSEARLPPGRYNLCFIHIIESHRPVATIKFTQISHQIRTNLAPRGAPRGGKMPQKDGLK